jgi:hypothetical protein
MAVAVNSSGSQTATIGTEHDLATITAADVFQPVIDVANMQGLITPDLLEVAAYGKARSSDTERLIAKWRTIGDPPTDLWRLPPIISPHYLRLTLKQTQGSSRAFPWAIYETGTTPSVDSSGSQTATISTEHTLATITGANVLELNVDVAAMAGGATPDLLLLRMYGKARSSDTERLEMERRIIGAQSDTLVKLLAVVSPHHCKLTLTQTQGTGRAYPWAAYKVQ